MKKLLSFAAIFAFAAALTACSEYEDQIVPEKPGTEEPTPDTPEEPDTPGQQATDKFLYYGDGVAVPFYVKGDDVYTLSLEFASTWGCLVRTSDTVWDAGTKYGAAAGNNRMEWGVPLTLIANSGSNDPTDILLPGMEQLMYHSHFWTDWFADLDYGAAASCETSPAFAAICDAAKKWIDLGVDGLRLDGAKHVYHNASSDENPTFWGKMFDELNGYFQSRGHSDKFYMVGEVYDDYDAAKPYYKGLPALFEFAFWYRLEWALNNSTGCYFANDICGYRDGYAAIRSDYIAATKLTNHDEDRAKSLLGGSEDKAKLAGAVLLTANGSPYIYYGEELGYVGIKNGKGDEYVRNPMKWGDSYTSTFIKQAESGMGNIKNAEAQAADDNSILNVYRKFSQLRNTYPALAHGKMTPHPSFNGNTASKSVAAWYMEADGQKMLVVHNFSGASTSISVSDNIAAVVGTLGSAEASAANGKTSLKLGKYSSLVALLDDAKPVEGWDGEKRADVSYQLLIYSFADSNGDGIGDFNGITAKLDYLDELGVSALWLSPAHPAMSYHGYDVLDYTALNPDYGTEADFKNLVDEAHRHGIKIYMDWVINHTGKDHPWFREALADSSSKYRDYYVLSENPQADIAAGKIAMINTEGAAGYDPGQWFPAVSVSSSEPQKLKFTLKWGTSPTLTVEQVDKIEN